MKSILTIKDLAQDTVLERKQMAAVRGGQGDQANGMAQFNALAGMASTNVANGSLFANSAPVIIQSDSVVEQHAANDNTSTNFKGIYGWLRD